MNDSNWEAEGLSLQIFSNKICHVIMIELDAFPSLRVSVTCLLSSLARLVLLFWRSCRYLGSVVCGLLWLMNAAAWVIAYSQEHARASLHHFIEILVKLLMKEVHGTFIIHWTHRDNISR